jgi:hypothetical protein
MRSLNRLENPPGQAANTSAFASKSFVGGLSEAIRNLPGRLPDLYQSRVESFKPEAPNFRPTSWYIKAIKLVNLAHFCNSLIYLGINLYL